MLIPPPAPPMPPPPKPPIMGCEVVTMCEALSTSLSACRGLDWCCICWMNSSVAMPRLPVNPISIMVWNSANWSLTYRSARASWVRTGCDSSSGKCYPANRDFGCVDRLWRRRIPWAVEKSIFILCKGHFQVYRKYESNTQFMCETLDNFKNFLGQNSNDNALECVYFHNS